MRLLVLAVALFAAAACSRGPVYRQSEEPPPVAHVDPERLAGLWHAQARLPSRAEQGCQRATVEHTLRDDGLMAVVHTCTDVRGKERVSRGRVRLAGGAGEGKLEVSFFGPFWTEYWVFDRGVEYSWSIVGDVEGRRLWVLTRSRTITPQRRAAFERRVAELGYRPAEFVWAATRERRRATRGYASVSKPSKSLPV